jgi:hypothetical protein
VKKVVLSSPKIFFSISILSFFLHFSFGLKIYLRDERETREKITNKKKLLISHNLAIKKKKTIFALIGFSSL